MLAHSGAVYSPGTVQYKLLRRHFFTEELARHAKEQWFALRILDLFDAVAVPYLEQNPRQQHKIKMMERMQTILDATNPFTSIKIPEAKPLDKQATQEDREKLVSLFGEQPYSSMKDIVDKFVDIKQRVAKAKQAAQ